MTESYGATGMLWPLVWGLLLCGVLLGRGGLDPQLESWGLIFVLMIALRLLILWVWNDIYAVRKRNSRYVFIDIETI